MGVAGDGFPARTLGKGFNVRRSRQVAQRYDCATFNTLFSHEKTDVRRSMITPGRPRVTVKSRPRHHIVFKYARKASQTSTRSPKHTLNALALVRSTR